jgi:hypothetical protein
VCNRRWLVILLVGCGSDAPPPDCRLDGGAACFQLPTAALQVRDATYSAGCGLIVPAPAPTAVTFTGDVATFGTNKPIANAPISLTTRPDFTSPVGTATSAADATYSLQLPQGTPDLLWGIVSGDGHLTTYVHEFRPDLSMGDIPDFDLRLFKADTIEGAAILVEEIWDPTAFAIAGFVFDCERRAVEHASVALSSTSGERTFVEGARLYYGAPGAVPLAVPPDERGDTNDNGAYAVFNVPPGATLFTQAWGFPDDAALAEGEAGLVLIAETAVHSVADAVGNVPLWGR